MAPLITDSPQARPTITFIASCVVGKGAWLRRRETWLRQRGVVKARGVVKVRGGVVKVGGGVVTLLRSVTMMWSFIIF